MAGSTTGSGDVPGFSDAVEAFAEHLNPDEDTQSGEGEEGSSTEGESAELEANEGEQSGEESTEGEESEGEGESEESGDEEDEGQQPAARTFTVRNADGKEEQVSESELIAGYQRQADYTRKTQAAAALRKEAEQEASQARAERAEYAQLLPKLRKALQVGMGKEPNWEELRQADPAKAAVEKQRWDERQQKLQAILAEEDRVAQQSAQETEELRKKIIKEQASKTLELLPQWAKADVRKKDVEEITQMLRDTGFGDDELVIHDARARKIAWMAKEYLRIKSQKQVLKTQIKNAPAVKPGGNQARRPSNEVQRASKRLAQTGSIRDAAVAFEQFVK